MTEVEALRDEVARLTAVLADTQAAIPAEWKLTDMEEKIFRVLLACDVGTRQAFADGAGCHGIRAPDIHILRIRQKTARFGVEIETVRARGWRLVGRFTWQRALGAIATQ